MFKCYLHIQLFDEGYSVKSVILKHNMEGTVYIYFCIILRSLYTPAACYTIKTI